MSTLYFRRQAGSSAMCHIAEDDSMLLIGDLSVPDVVRLPPELGGERRRVTGHASQACVCGCAPAHGAQHLFLGDLAVAECPVRGEFLWYRRPQEA